MLHNSRSNLFQVKQATLLLSIMGFFIVDTIPADTICGYLYFSESTLMSYPNKKSIDFR